MKINYPIKKVNKKSGLEMNLTVGGYFKSIKEKYSFESLESLKLNGYETESYVYTYQG